MNLKRIQKHPMSAGVGDEQHLTVRKPKLNWHDCFTADSPPDTGTANQADFGAPQ